MLQVVCRQAHFQHDGNQLSDLRCSHRRWTYLFHRRISSNRNHAAISNSFDDDASRPRFEFDSRPDPHHFALFEAVLDVMCRVRHLCGLQWRRLSVRIREDLVLLEAAIGLRFAGNN